MYGCLCKDVRVYCRRAVRVYKLCLWTGSAHRCAVQTQYSPYYSPFFLEKFNFGLWMPIDLFNCNVGGRIGGIGAHVKNSRTEPNFLGREEYKQANENKWVTTKCEKLQTISFGQIRNIVTSIQTRWTFALHHHTGGTLRRNVPQ